MTRRILGWMVLCVIATSIAVSAQHVYAIYYSRSPEQDLEVNLVNTTASDNAYEISAFDVLGNPSWQTTGQLAANDTTFYLLSDQLPEGPAQWGVLVVVSASRLVLGLEYSYQGQLHTIDVVADEVVIPSEGTAYSLVAYHTEVGQAVTGVILMNPFTIDAAGRLIVRGSDGSVLDQIDVTLTPRESDIYNLADLVGQAGRNWGSVELQIDQGMMVLACKYIKSGILQVANVAAARPVSSAPCETCGDEEQQKED
jgi:hypothetical protein